MQRLFTGIEIPSAIGQELALLKGGLFSARWIDPDDYHITLRFLGAVHDALADELHERLAQIRRPVFDIDLQHLDVFGGDHPRALIVRVGLNDELRELQAEHERICRRLGLAPETRKFTPHITLARLRNAGPQEAAQWLVDKGVFRQKRFTTYGQALFSSRASTGGGPYIVEARYPFQRVPALQP
jgi:RNA 2',3'-cyclic 3'-phosphodiesterase